MPIPRMTPEDIELEERYYFRRKLESVPRHKRWIVSLILNCFVAWGYIHGLRERMVLRQKTKR
jgi:hypothetical protein